MKNRRDQCVVARRFVPMMHNRIKNRCRPVGAVGVVFGDAGDDPLDAFDVEHLAFIVHGFAGAVCVGDQGVALLEIDRLGFEFEI